MEVQVEAQVDPTWRREEEAVEESRVARSGVRMGGMPSQNAPLSALVGTSN